VVPTNADPWWKSVIDEKRLYKLKFDLILAIDVPAKRGSDALLKIQGEGFMPRRSDEADPEMAASA
jgi:hypothetical protein